MNGARARRLCPDAIVVPPRFSAYVEASGELFDLFRDTSPVVEGLSLEEAFLDVRGLERISGTPSEIARRLRRRARDEVGLPVTVGIARTKTLAKMASRAAKPDGLLVVRPDEESAFLHPLAGRGALGSGSGDRAAPARRGHRARRPAGRAAGDGDRLGRRARRRPSPSRGRAQSRSPARAARAPPALVRIAVGARALVPARRRRSTRSWSRWPTGSRGGCAPGPASAAR